MPPRKQPDPYPDSARPTPKMARLYNWLRDRFGEPKDLWVYDPAEYDDPPPHLTLKHVMAWPADRDCDVTSFHTLGHTPALVQSRCRRQQVTPDGKQAGMSFHRMAFRSWYTIPAKHALSSANGCPPFG